MAASKRDHYRQIASQTLERLSALMKLARITPAHYATRSGWSRWIRCEKLITNY